MFGEYPAGHAWGPQWFGRSHCLSVLFYFPHVLVVNVKLIWNGTLDVFFWRMVCSEIHALLCVFHFLWLHVQSLSFTVIFYSFICGWTCMSSACILWYENVISKIQNPQITDKHTHFLKMCNSMYRNIVRWLNTGSVLWPTHIRLQEWIPPRTIQILWSWVVVFTSGSMVPSHMWRAFLNMHLSYSVQSGLSLLTTMNASTVRKRLVQNVKMAQILFSRLFLSQLYSDIW